MTTGTAVVPFRRYPFRNIPARQLAAPAGWIWETFQNGGRKEVRYLRPTLIEHLKRRRASRYPHFLTLDIQLERYMERNKRRLPEGVASDKSVARCRTQVGDNGQLCGRDKWPAVAVGRLLPVLRTALITGRITDVILQLPGGSERIRQKVTGQDVNTASFISQDCIILRAKQATVKK